MPLAKSDDGAGADGVLINGRLPLDRQAIELIVS